MSCKWHCQAPAWEHCGVFHRFLLFQAMKNLFMCGVFILLGFSPDAYPRARSPELLLGSWLCHSSEGVFWDFIALCWEVFFFSNPTHPHGLLPHPPLAPVPREPPLGPQLPEGQDWPCWDRSGDWISAPSASAHLSGGLGLLCRGSGILSVV